MPELVVDQVLTGAELGLDWGLSDILVADIGGRQVLYALGRTDGKLAEVEVAADGTLVPVATLSLSGTFSAGSEPMLGLVGGSGGPSLALAGMASASGSFVALGADGTLGAQFAEPGVGELVAPQGLSLSAGDALVSGRKGAGGLDLYVDAGAGYAWAAGIDDTATTYLGDVTASATLMLGQASHVVTASAGEHGITLTRIDDPGNLTVTGTLGAAEGLPVGTPSDLAVVERMGETLIFLAASGSSSLSSILADAAGELWMRDHVLDQPSTFLQSVAAVDALAAGDFVFVAAGGPDNGLSLFTALPGGRLVHLDSVADDAATSLYRVSTVSMSASSTTLRLFAGSSLEPGVTRLSWDISQLGAVLVGTGQALAGTPGDDQLVGSDTGEALDGGAGGDILLDGQGIDSMSGGAGADLFVFAFDGAPDYVTDFERGVDRLDLSAFDFLSDVGQLTVTPTATGADIAFGGEVIHLTTADLAPLSAAELSNGDILNVDRPPLLPVHDALSGGAQADTLFGGAGDDTITGGDGDDLLLGGFGNDAIFGGLGADDIDGGGGADTIDGGPGGDTIHGGEGSDLITGGDGGDVIYGDDAA